MRQPTSVRRTCAPVHGRNQAHPRSCPPPSLWTSLGRRREPHAPSPGQRRRDRALVGRSRLVPSERPRGLGGDGRFHRTQQRAGPWGASERAAQLHGYAGAVSMRGMGARCARSRARREASPSRAGLALAGHFVVPSSEPARMRRASGARWLTSTRAAQAGAKPRPCHPNPHEKRRTEGPDRLFEGDTADVRERRAIIGRSRLCSRRPGGGPRGLARDRRVGLKSTKKPGSSSIPPSGSQFTRSSHERSPG